MSNLEHLIENTLVAMEDDRLCFNDIRKRVQNDPNIQGTSLSADDVLEICQYVKYVWCRDLENRLNAQYKEARKLLTPAKYKIKHEEGDMHGEHYMDDYAVCPNCGKVFGNIKWLYIAKGICYSRINKTVSFGSFCPDCGQKIDWNIDDRKIKED